MRNWLWWIARKLGMKVTVSINGDITLRGAVGRLATVNGEDPDTIEICGDVHIPKGGFLGLNSHLISKGTVSDDKYRNIVGNKSYNTEDSK